MTDLELQQARAEKWHLDGRPVRTLDEARSFLNLYPAELMSAAPAPKISEATAKQLPGIESEDLF